MNKKYLILIFPFMLSLAGCSGMNEKPTKQVAKTVKPKTLPPKPNDKKSATAPVQKPEKAVPGTATYAIDDGKKSFKVEPTPSALKAGAPSSATAVVPQETQQPPTAAAASATSSPAGAPVVAAPSEPQGVQVAKPAPAAPAMPAFPVEDARLPAGSPPAVLALLTEADKNRASGDLDAAVVSTERALRIDSRNPTLTYKLAQLRIKQNKPQLAEELAGKAALLAGNNLDLKRKSWLLIAEARRQQQNIPGAKEAKAKADSFIGH